MLGFAIAEGIISRQKSWQVRGQSLACQLWNIKTRNGGSFSIASKLPAYNIRRNIHGGIGRRSGSEPRVSNSCSRGAGLFQARSSSQVAFKPYDIETNLPKDVILFKYENPKYFKRLNIFAVSQLAFWTYLAHFVFSQLKDVPVSEEHYEDLPWWRRINFGEKTHRVILTFFTFFVGYSLFALAWVHTLKSVRYLVLRKGGKDLTFVTYTPFGENRLRTVPLDKMTSKQSREAATVHLPIKVKGDWMHYLLDMRGEFKHPRLFDFTAGLKRPI